MAKPFFSIIIPTYDRPYRLKTCLESLCQLDYPRDQFEVIVVNDGDPHLTDSAIAPYQDSINIQLVHQPNTGPAGARNTGAKHSIGQFLAFTDDDCQPAPNWLSCLAQHCMHKPNCAIGGQTVNALPNNIYSTASQLHGDAVYDYYNQIQGDSTFLASCNFAVPRTLYQHLGGFDTSFPLAAGEDREFCDRWLRNGYSMIYEPSACVYHTHTLNLSSFFKQHFNYGRGAFVFHQIRNNGEIEPIKTDLRFYWHVITYPFQQTSVDRAFVLSTLFIVANLAKTVGFSWQRFGQGHLHLLSNQPVRTNGN